MKRKRSPATTEHRTTSGPEIRPDNAGSSCRERREIPRNQKTTPRTTLGSTYAPTARYIPTLGPKLGWDQNYGTLQEFHHHHGHSNVPQRYPNDRALGTWVSRQRSLRGTTIAVGPKSPTFERHQLFVGDPKRALRPGLVGEVPTP